MALARFFSILLLLAVLCAVGAVRSQAQRPYSALVLDQHDEPLAGVNVVVSGTTIGAVTDAEGRVDLDAVPSGTQTILFSFVGFEPQQVTYTFPQADPTTIHVVRMDEAEDELDEVAVTATRTSRTIADIPTSFFWATFISMRGRITTLLNTPLPLTPEHKTYTVLVYEQHGKGRIGPETYYTGPQRLPDSSPVGRVLDHRCDGGASIWGGAAFPKLRELLDTKQSNYAPVVLGSRSNPRFAEIWTPMDGFIVNGGIKYSL